MLRKTTFPKNPLLVSLIALAGTCFFLLPLPLAAQTTAWDAEFMQGLEWRNIGPFRGGRVNAVCGVPGQAHTYYMGSTGGGVWKTEDGGLSWRNISDDYFKSGSIGALAVASSDPNVVFAGTGEHAVRGVMTSAGDGLYKSTDGGQSWSHSGLPNSQHIAAIRIHPGNPELLYVAVQGALYGPSEDRGVYRSTDGGESWEKVLFVNPTTGAADLSMDPNNPRILYAGMWDHQRQPWEIRSGGPGSGIYKSTDGGDSWEKLEKGLPASMGKVAVDVSPADPQVVYANLEAEAGGVYRSDDGGRSWRRTCADRVTIARAWYYIEIFADPRDANKVYVLNAPMLRSIDGGKTFSPVANPHSDQHDLWINPDDPQNMILGNDGGACITVNGGKTWSSQNNQPTVQFYRVIADRQFPYHLYAGQQDNSTVDIVSRSNGAGIGFADWRPVSGGESAFLAFDPDDPQKIYGNSIQGFIDVFDESTDLTRDIMAYPAINLGSPPREMKYRYNWNNPLITDPFDRNTLYHGAQLVLRSRDGGLSWEEISPDLTRNDTSRQGPGGRPFTNEAAGGENYNTLSYLEASEREAGLIWAGSDDGLIHLTRDGGATWKNVTPPDLPESLINAIDASPHRDGAAYAAVTRYKFQDTRPIILYTEDYGASWSRLESNLPEDNFVRVVREDEVQEGLLYAGMERGLYISADNGASWHPFRLNLPHLTINDLTQADHDLVAATAGRGFWILDDLSPVRQWAAGADTSSARLFRPADQIRFWTGASGNAPPGQGQNQPDGFPVTFFLPESMDSVNISLRILDDSGREVRRFASKAESRPDAQPAESPMPSAKGINRFYWDLRRRGQDRVKAAFIYGSFAGTHVGPGSYTLRLCLPTDTLEQSCRLLPDPRLEAEPAAYRAQQTLLREMEDLARDAIAGIERMRTVRQQFERIHELLTEDEAQQALRTTADSLARQIRKWDDRLIQNKQQTFQDVINFTNRFLAELLSLKSTADTHDPHLTEGVKTRFADLRSEWSAYAARQEILLDEVAAFNALYREKGLPVILLPEK